MVSLMFGIAWERPLESNGFREVHLLNQQLLKQIAAEQLGHLRLKNQLYITLCSKSEELVNSR